MTPSELCVRRFLDGASCAQAVFSTFTEGRGLDLEVRMRLASAFGSGARLSDGTCGALVGALLVLGLREGFSGPRDVEGRRKLHALAGRLTSAFAERNGSVLCREVVGFDLGTEQGRAAARQGQRAADTRRRAIPVVALADLECDGLARIDAAIVVAR
ncbi:MAG TPA: C-GCAxxG-C-C family protein, partial [Polyangiaceae bacterium]|nr:C-GCAxxG-C-C family protein [Polyangiaceae bacterium]